MDGLATYRGHPFSLFMLHNRIVAEDLGLSANQKAEVESLIKAYARDTRDKIRSMKPLVDSAQRDPDGPAKKALADLSATLNETSDHYEALSLRLIDPRQRERLEQLRLQAKGFRVFFDSRVCKELGITAGQKEKIDKIDSDCGRKSMEIATLVKGHKMEGKEGMKVVSGLRREAREAALQVLTPAQREKLDRMLGPRAPFEPGELVLREVLDR
jgi:Spy/CpxP family protein refolding chaperone